MPVWQKIQIAVLTAISETRLPFGTEPLVAVVPDSVVRTTGRGDEMLELIFREHYNAVTEQANHSRKHSREDKRVTALNV